jgi:RNA polymerase sigma factor (sigma-70 family)
MARSNSLGTALRSMFAVTDSLPHREVSDRALMQQFLTLRDEGAFATLLKRHGPMVLGVASRVLLRHADAEDVYQATFLLLARKMSTIRKSAALASWLHGVAFHLALRVRGQRANRTRREQRAATMRSIREIRSSDSVELEAMIDAALRELPDIYRQAIVICHLEGVAHAEAARALGCSTNTYRSRLARGRKRLRGIFQRQGVVLTAGSLATMLTSATADAGRSAPLLRQTLEACLSFAGGKSAETVAAGSVAALVNSGLKSLFLAKAMMGSLLLLSLGLLVGMTGAVSSWASQGPASEEVSSARFAPRREAQQAARKRPTDNFGDALPEGAIQRLGTIRFRHGGRIESVAYSPDGTQIVTGGADAKVKIWDRKTGKALITFEGHSDDVHFVTFTPDGKYVISSSGGMRPGQDAHDPCTLKWDAATGNTVLRFPPNKWNREMAALTLSPDGKQLAACLSPELYVFNVATGELLHTYAADQGAVLRLRFSPDGKKLAMVGMGQGVSLIEVNSGKLVWLNDQRVGNITIFEPAAPALAFSPDGRRLAVRVAPEGQQFLPGPCRMLNTTDGA